MKSAAAIFACAIALAVNATVIDVTPGSLGGGVTVDRMVTDLTLHGEIDGRDLQYISSHLRNLRRLDISDVGISAYTGDERIGGNYHSHPAGVLPPYSLAGATITEIILPAGITAIGDGALMSSRLTSVSIPSNVVEIGMGAFADCRDLTEASVPASVTKSGSHIFKDCPVLAKVSFEASSVPAYAFNNCQELAEVTFGNELEDIGDHAFYATSIAILNLGNCHRLHSIGARAFAQCPELEEITLPDGLSDIGEGVFLGDTKLTNIHLPESLTSLPDMALTGVSASAGSSNLLPRSLESIGTLALAHITGARTVVLPSGLTEIGDYAFEGWTSLDSIDATALHSIPTLGENVWLAVEQPEVTLTVPGEMLEAYQESDQWKQFNIVGHSGGTSGIDNVTSDSDSRILIRFDGMTLHVMTGTGVTSATLHDLTGIRLASLAPSGATELSIDTSPWQTQLFILSLTLEPDGKRVALKIIR